MERKGSLATTHVSTLSRMLETLYNIIDNVDKVHQEPQKFIIYLNVVPCEDSMGVETLPACIQALLLVPQEGCSLHEAAKL